MADPLVQTSAFDPSVEPVAGNYFVSTYPPFSLWTETGAEALRQSLTRPAPREAESFGLYVHLPFCVERCLYCYYLAYDDRPRQMDRYLEALARELQLYAESPAFAGRQVGFVYFGGGTPSLLSASRLGSLVARLQAIFPWGHAREVTFECAPASVTEEKLRVLREVGVTRLSMGVQELDDGVLEQNGRVHRVADVQKAWAAIRKVGFEVVNVDLIAGLVGQSDASFLHSLEQVIDMSPESVTIYQLEIPRNTPLYRLLQEGGLASEPGSWEDKRRRLRLGFERLEDAGYVLRSAYTAVRDPQRHRFVYQDAQYRGTDLLGIGASSFSYLWGIGQQNLAALEPYLDRLDGGRLPLWRGYVLSDEERLVRELVLQLKLGQADAAYFRRKFGVELTRRFAAAVESLARRGWLEADTAGLALSREGLLRADRLLPAFYQPQHRGVRYS